MASVRQDRVQVVLEIEGNQAKAELDNLERKQQVISNSLKLMKKGTDEYVQKNKELKDVNKDIDAHREKLGSAGMTMQQLGKHAKQLFRELQTLTPGTDTFIKKSAELSEVNTRLADVKKQARGIGEELDKTSGGFLEFAKKSAVFTGVYMGLEGVLSSIKQIGSESVNSAARTSDKLADIQKSTGMTKEEVDALNESLKLIDTRTTQEDLQSISFVGGQIGVAAQDVEGFTEAVDKAVVALGDEFTGGAEEVATKMGTLQKLFKETKDMDPGEAINRIGSAVNALGAAGTATGPVVADFTQRIGQLGDLAPEISQTLGLGAAFQELGLSAEIASGGLTNVMLTAAKDTAGFAAQIGITEKEFVKLINSDPNEVILQLAESLKGASSTQITQTLDALGIKSQEATKVMNLLASKTDFVREKQALASIEMEKATSLTEEFNIKNTTAAAEIDKSEKNLAAYKDEIGKGLIPVYLKYLQIQGTVIDVLRALPRLLRENKEVLGLLVLGLLIWNKELIVSNALALKDVAMKQLQASWIFRTTIAQQGLNAALKANPIGAVIVAVAALVYAFKELERVSTRNQEVQKQTKDLNNKLKTAVDEVAKAQRELNGQVANYNSLAPEEQAKLREKIRLQKQSALATLEQIEVDKKAVIAKAAEVDIFDKIKAGILSAGNASAYYAQVTSGQAERMSKANSGFSAQISKLKEQLTNYDAFLSDINNSEQTGQEEKAAAITEAEKKELEKRQREREKAAEKERQRLEKEKNEQLQALRKIQDMQNAAITDEFDRKIATLRTQAAREIEEAKGTAQQIADQKTLIEARLSTDIAAIERARAADRLKLAEETAEKEQEIRNRYTLAKADLGVLQAEERLKSAIAEAGITNRFEKQKQAEEDLLSAKQNVLDREREIRMQAMEQDAQDKLQADILNLELSGDEKRRYESEAQAALDAEKELLDAEHQQRKDDLHKQYTDTQAEREKQAQMQAIGTLQQATDGFFQLKQLANEREMAKLDKDKRKRMAQLDQEYKAGSISKEQYESSKNSIETNYDAKARAIKKKAAEDEKASNIASSIMAGWLAVTKAAPNIPLQVATGILAALNTAKIIATPLPTFAKGGMIGGALRTAKRLFSSGGAINPVAGVPSVGQSHDNGGIKMMDGATGEYLGEWERGEPYMILSKNTYANNKGVIDSLLDSSLYRGGAPIMQKGGIYAANGAVVNGSSGGSSAGATGVESFDVLVSEVRGLRQDVQLLPRNQRAYVVYQDIEEAGAELHSVRSDASSG